MAMIQFQVPPELAAIGGRRISKADWKVCQKAIKEGGATSGAAAYRAMLIETGKTTEEALVALGL